MARKSAPARKAPATIARADRAPAIVCRPAGFVVVAAALGAAIAPRAYLVELAVGDAGTRESVTIASKCGLSALLADKVAQFGLVDVLSVSRA